MIIEERDYQTEGIAIGSNTSNGLLVEPTGSGKSVIVGGLSRELEGGTLVLQPSQEILESNYEKVLAYDLEASIYSAALKKRDVSDLTYATIKSIINKLDQFSHVKNIIIDEAHCVNAKGGQYEKLISTLKPDVLLGLTATPYRLYSNKNYGSSMKLLNRTRPKTFKDIVHVTNPRDLLARGYLDEPLIVEGSPNLSSLRMNSNATEFTDASIMRFTEDNNMVDQVFDLIVNEAYKKNHILVFFKNVKDSKELVKKLFLAGIKAAEINCDTKKRGDILKLFHDGTIKVIANVGTLTTGYDFPALDCAIDASPTTSAALHYQKFGRLVRVFLGKSGVYYDLAGNIQRLGNPLNYTLLPNSSGLWEVYSERGRVTTRVISDVPECDKIVDFGQYRNSLVRDLPEDYLNWVIDGGLKSKKYLAEWKHICYGEKVRREVFDVAV